MRPSMFVVVGFLFLFFGSFIFATSIFFAHDIQTRKERMLSACTAFFLAIIFMWTYPRNSPMTDGNILSDPVNAEWNLTTVSYFLLANDFALYAYCILFVGLIVTALIFRRTRKG